MKYLIILLSIANTFADWELVFNDEFNNSDSIDQNKWIVENEQEACNGNMIKQLNCITSSKRNVRLMNGTLALTAIREKHLNKEFTSSVINSRDSFRFGKFEFRVALPSGKMLRPLIILKPTSRSGKSSEDGEVVIVTSNQKNILEQNIYFTSNGEPKYVGEKYSITVDLKDFHTYILEWNEKGLIFKFDGIKLAIIDFFREIKNSANPFLKPFTISIGLGVGGLVFKNQILSEDDVNEWNCSALIVDYVRVYKFTNDKSVDKKDPIIGSDRKSSTDICNAIMLDIKAESNQKNELATDSPIEPVAHENSKISLISNSTINNPFNITKNSVSKTTVPSTHGKISGKEGLNNIGGQICSNLTIILLSFIIFKWF